MKIGNIEIKNGGILAPMAGFTDVGFRHICKKLSASLTVTEMVSAKGMVMGSEKTRGLLAVTDIENPVAVQIFGHEPEVIYDCIQMPEMEKFDIIDINMGCPVPKIVKNGEGSALLRTQSLAKELVKSAVKATKKPITIKMRIGFDAETDKQTKFSAVDFAKAMQDAGASMVAVHGRSRAQGYSGTADWKTIADIKQALDIPVVANGDVRSVEDYHNILSATGAEGVMIGRGCLGNPWLFSDVLGIERKYTAKELILLHIEILEEYYPDRAIVNMLKKQIHHYIGAGLGRKELRNKIALSKSLDETKEIVNSFEF